MPDETPMFGSADLTNCDREPVHIPGSVQGRGALLVYDPTTLLVSFASENIDRVLGKPVNKVVGRPLPDLIGRKAAHKLSNLAASAAEPAQPACDYALSWGEELETVDIAVHLHREQAIVEFEFTDRPVVYKPPDPDAPRLLLNLASMLASAQTAEELLQKAALVFQGLLRWDRVMIYRFETDDSGTVVAEEHQAGIEPFLGLHYPATDIPQPARDLFLRNPLRSIADVADEAIPIRGAVGRDPQTLDLSYTDMRAVSPIHIEYLKYMGVQATLSASIRVEGKLWGLVACHHYSPATVPLSMRANMVMLADDLSARLLILEHREALAAARSASELLESVIATFPKKGILFTDLVDGLSQFEEVIPNTGFGIYVDGQWTSQGFTPPRQAVDEIADYLQRQDPGTVFETDHLAAHIPSAAAYASTASGLLAVPVSPTTQSYMIYFRREIA